MKIFQRDSVNFIPMALVGLAVVSFVCSTLWFAQRQAVIFAYEKGAHSAAPHISEASANKLFYDRVNECVRNKVLLYVSDFEHLTISQQTHLDFGRQSYKECYNQQIEWAQHTVLLPRL